MSFLTHEILTQTPSAYLSAPAPRVGWFGRILRTWLARNRERQAFARLDDRDLRDLGLSRYEVEKELAKPFWRE